MHCQTNDYRGWSKCTSCLAKWKGASALGGHGASDEVHGCPGGTQGHSLLTRVPQLAYLTHLSQVWIATPLRRTDAAPFRHLPSSSGNASLFVHYAIATSAGGARSNRASFASLPSSRLAPLPSSHLTYHWSAVYLGTTIFSDYTTSATNLTVDNGIHASENATVPAHNQGPALTQVETITSNNGPNPPQQNKIKHRSSKPILAWVQRKLTAAASGAAGKVHHKESQSVSGISGGQSTSNGEQQRRTSGPQPTRSGGNHQQRRHSHRKHTDTYASRSSQRSRSLERASMGAKDMRRMAVRNQQHSPGPLGSSIGGIPAELQTLSQRGSESAPPSPRSGSLSFSGAPGSTWSNAPEADDDASIRPLPPTSPPSPAPSRSTHYTVSSYTSGGGMSDPRTFRSGAASTKPTTLLSIDVGPQVQGMAHIAQAPPSTTGGSVSGGPGTAPSSPSFGRFPSTRGHAQVPSVASITFGNLPSGPRHPLASALSPETDYEEFIRAEEEEENAVNTAPNMSHYHPRNNPRPSSPPLDNASTYTLASSTYAMPHRQHGPPSVVSRFPGSISMHGHGGPRSLSGLNPDLYDGDGDASVRALRPRSRAGSWGSMASTETGWSAAVHALGPSTRRAPGAGSMRTTDDVDDEGSIRYGPMDQVDEVGAKLGDVRLDESTITTTGAPTEGHAKRPGSLTIDAKAAKPDASLPQPEVGIMLTLPTPDQSRITTPMTEQENSLAQQLVATESEKPSREKVHVPTAAEEVKAEAIGESKAPVAVAVQKEEKGVAEKES